MKHPAADVVVAGKYCLEGQLASGGMGSVWVARHLDLELPVAIKFMGPECALSEEGRNRFEREAKTAAYLQSPHVVNVQDYGIDDGLAYIVMELLVGEDLDDRLRRVGRLSLEDTLAILSQTAKALRRAQELGIVHRDIKPQNLFLATGDDNEEHLKVLDFGIAKETGPVLLAKGANTGQIIGSPNYMSPEQVRGVRDIDHRADLWSLGVIVFQCITGRLPFPGDVVGDVMGMILADPIPLATKIAPDLPPEIDAFFAKALARDRNERFQSARDMVEAFASIARPGAPGSIRFTLSTPIPPLVQAKLAAEANGDRDSSIAPSSLAAAEVGARSKKAAGAPASAKSEEQARPRRGALVAAVAVLAVGGVLLFAMRTGGPASTADPGSAAAATADVPGNDVLGPVATAQPTATAPAKPAQTAEPEPAATTAAGSGTGSAGSKTATPPTKSSGRPATTAAPKGSTSASSKPKHPWGF